MSYNAEEFRKIWEALNEFPIDESAFDFTEIDDIGENHNALLEMASIGEYGSFKITVYGGEGPIPHFHIYDKQTKRKICLKIGKAEYFKHGQYTNELDRDERKLLQKWLSLPNEDIWMDTKEKSSNYREICIEWNRNNRNCRVDVDQSIPDYAHMR